DPRRGRTLDGIQGGVTVMGETNTAPQILVDDSGDMQMGPQGTFSSDSSTWGINGLAPGRLSVSNLRARSTIHGLCGAPLPGQGGGNAYTIQSTPAGTSLTVNAGTGTDTINVGSTTHTLDAILGAVSVNGKGANTTLNVNDDGTAVSQWYQGYATSIHRRLNTTSSTDNIAAIGYQNVGTGVLNLGPAQTGLNPGA